MKKKILVIYKSSTGFTKKYAEMIAKETECTLVDYRMAAEEMWSEYGIIVFGSRAHAGTLDGYKKIRQKFQKHASAKLVLFATGALPAQAEDIISEFWSRNLTEEELRKVPHFYMPGGLCYEKMNVTDKLMMKTFAAVLKRKKDKNSYEREAAKVICNSYDISSPDYIKPLVSLLKASIQ